MDSLPLVRPGAAIESAAQTRQTEHDRMRSTSQQFEKMFVAEMLRLTELGGTIGGEFSGGFGEEAFKSFMIDAYAEQIADTGQFGIAQTIFAALSGKESS